MANAQHHQAKRVAETRAPAKAADATGTQAAERVGSTGKDGSEEPGASPAAIGGTIFKIAPAKENTGAFKRVPRAFHHRVEEKERSRNPPVGGYRPKHACVAPRVHGVMPYDSFTKTGVEQAVRIRAGQFEESSKLCMCILKALDQEQVDLNHNPKLKSQIYI
jgi:hypothetical protein